MITTTTKIKDLGNNEQKEYIIPTIVFDSTTTEVQRQKQLQQLQEESKLDYLMKRISIAMNDLMDQIIPKKKIKNEQTEDNEMLTLTDPRNELIHKLLLENQYLKQQVVDLQKQLQHEQELRKQIEQESIEKQQNFLDDESFIPQQ